MAYRVPLEVVLEVVLGVEWTVCAPTRRAALALHDSMALHDSDDSIWDTRRRGDQGLAAGRRRQGRGLGH